jgi:AcrR family transcriptional regulator
MGTTERRERQRAELRGHILAAARRIVVDEGFAALTMRRIAEAIEYSPAAIYQYFENRDAIAEAISREGFSELLEALAPARSIADPRARLEEVGRVYVRFGLERSQTYRLMFMEDPKITTAVLGAPNPDDPGTHAYDAIAQPMRALLSHSDDRVVLAHVDAFWCALHGIVSLKLTCPKFPATPTDELVATMLRTFLDGVTPAARR